NVVQHIAFPALGEEEAVRQRSPSGKLKELLVLVGVECKAGETEFAGGPLEDALFAGFSNLVKPFLEKALGGGNETLGKTTLHKADLELESAGLVSAFRIQFERLDRESRPCLGSLHNDALGGCDGVCQV